MIEKKVKTVEAVSEKEELLDLHQICNELKISGIRREYVEKRFAKQSKTLTEWKDSFKKVRLDF